MLDLFLSQNNRCALSNRPLVFNFQRNRGLEHTASLDRIDSSKGYIPGNIQFISAICNYAKNDLSHEEMIVFCKLLADNWK